MNNRIYLSGPITGIPDFKDNFKQARFQLQEAIRSCIAHRSCRYSDCPFYDRNFILGCTIVEISPDNPEFVNPADFDLDGRSWLICMVVCVARLLPCSHVYMLRGWQNSRGARIEHRIAQLFNKRIIYQSNE